MVRFDFLILVGESLTEVFDAALATFTEADACEPATPGVAASTDPAAGEGAEEAPPGSTAAVPPVDGTFFVAGSPVGATDWFLASRGTSSARAARVVVANVSSKAVKVTVDELVDGRHAALPSASITIPAGDRRSLALGEAEAASALIIKATGPVVVSHTLIARAGAGIAQALATPFPEAVIGLPAAR